MRKALACLAFVVGAAGQVPTHEAHTPNNSNGIVVYGAVDLEPAALRPGIVSWLGKHFDWTIGGAVRTNSAVPPKTWWPGYVDMAYVYANQLYQVDSVAKANSFVLEKMFLHSSVDLQIRNGYGWSNMEQFDAFEPKVSGAAVNGVFTCVSGTCRDVTQQSWTGTPSTSVNNELFVGYMEPFDQMNFEIRTGRAGGSVAYQYWNGSAWVPLSPVSDGTLGLSATGKITFVPPADWTQTAVGSSRPKYWVHVLIAGASQPPAYNRVFGDSWTAASGANNLRGWSSASQSRINIGTRLEYNPVPPPTATAKFPYQARATGIFAPNAMIGNPSDKQQGVRSWGKWLTDNAGMNLVTGQDGIMFDDAGAAPTQIASPANFMSYFDFNQSSTWAAEVAAMYREMVARLHATYGFGVPGQSGFQVGTNGYLGDGDWALCEGWWCGINTYASANIRYGLQGDTLRYDLALPQNNPQNGKIVFTCMDNAKEWEPALAVGYASRHYVDRSNRTPLMCLAMHYIGWNTNSVFAYNTMGYYYSTTDEVSVYGPETTLASSVASDTSNVPKIIRLTDASGCDTPAEWAGNNYAVRLGTKDKGDTVAGTLAGNILTTTYSIFESHEAGTPAFCIQTRHLSATASPVASNVYKWSRWFPAMEVDLGGADPSGFRSGARAITEAGNTPWKKGGAPDYISGLTHAQCDASPNACSDVWRRDFRNAIVLFRPWQTGMLEAEVDTYSADIPLGRMYYPLAADGSVGLGKTSIKLRAGESAILMKKNRCDLNSDGRVDVVDVVAAVNQALGSITCSTADVDGSGACNIVDVQLLVNVVLGGSCLAR